MTNADEVVENIAVKHDGMSESWVLGYEFAKKQFKQAILSGVLAPNNLGVVSGGRSPACKAGVEADSRGGSIPSAPNSNPKPLEEKCCPVCGLTDCVHWEISKAERKSQNPQT